MVMAAFQGVWRRASLRGGVAHSGGARGHDGEARGRLWPRRRAAALSGVFRRRGRERQRRSWGRGRVRGGSRGWRGAAEDAQGEEEAARQGGGVASSAASRCPSSAYWHEEEGDRGRRLVGWAAQVGCQHRSWAGCWRQVSFLCSVLLFCFLLLISFAIVLNLNKFKQCQKTPLNIFILLYGLFQKLIKHIRGI